MGLQKTACTGRVMYRILSPGPGGEPALLPLLPLRAVRRRTSACGAGACMNDACAPFFGMDH